MQPEVQSICGVLNNLLAYKKKTGGINVEGNGGSQGEAKELCNVIAKAEKIGMTQLPESQVRVTDLATGLSELRMSSIMTLDPTILNNPSVSTSSHVSLSYSNLHLVLRNFLLI